MKRCLTCWSSSCSSAVIKPLSSSLCANNLYSFVIFLSQVIQQFCSWHWKRIGMYASLSFVVFLKRFMHNQWTHQKSHFSILGKLMYLYMFLFCHRFATRFLSLSFLIITIYVLVSWFHTHILFFPSLCVLERLGTLLGDLCSLPSHSWHTEKWKEPPSANNPPVIIHCTCRGTPTRLATSLTTEAVTAVVA